MVPGTTALNRLHTTGGEVRRVAPTLLDILGQLLPCGAALQNRPDEVKGHWLKPAIDRISTKTSPTGSENVRASHIPAPLAKKPTNTFNLQLAEWGWSKKFLTVPVGYRFGP